MTLHPNELAKILKELSDALEELATIIGEQREIDKELNTKLRQVLKKIPKKQPEKTDEDLARRFLKKAYKKDYLRQWLIDKNFKIGKSIDNFQVDDRLYRVADYLADHYNQLEDFYKQLKAKQSRKNESFLFLSTADSIKYIRKWADMLLKAKLIDGFRAISANQVGIDLALIKEATNFINGMWLEIFLRRELAYFFLKNYQQIHSFDLLADIHVTLPDNTAGELDVMVMINEQVYWFECKSGQIGEHYYSKYKKINNYLNLFNGHSALVLPRMNLHQPEIIKTKTGMEPLFATDLEKYLPSFFKQAFE